MSKTTQTIKEVSQHAIGVFARAAIMGQKAESIIAHQDVGYQNWEAEADVLVYLVQNGKVSLVEEQVVTMEAM